MLSFLPFISLALYHTNSQTLNNCTWINGGTCYFFCDELSGVDCIGSTINCLSDLDCNVCCCDYEQARRRNLLSSYSCSDIYGCCGSVINCAPGKTCWIDCDRGCSNLTVNAIEATSLSITSCESNNGANNCAFMNIYCPRNGRGGATDICQIEGYSSSKQIEHTNIYTEEGLNDLKISNVKTIGTRIFCGKTSGFSCILNSNGDGCDSGQPTMCENYIIPTSGPTLEPTSYPSLYPTEPSLYPSVYPTLYPTEPSLYPTEPSLYPSLYPTKAETTTTYANTDSFVESKGKNDVDSTLVIIIGILSFIIIVFVAASLFYCKPWKKQNIKPNPDMNINNVEIVKKDDGDIVTAINKTDIGFVGTSNDDYDVVTAINKTDIGNSDDDAMKLVKINSISYDADNTTTSDINDGNTVEVEKQAMNANDVSAVHEGVNYNLDEDGAKEVNVWLKSIGCLMYYDIFIQNGFDSMESIQEITDKNVLNDIGITLVGHQLKLMKYIKKSKAM